MSRLPASQHVDERHGQVVAEGEKSRAALWFVGALPPPLNGQSNCNAAMLTELASMGARVRCHDIGGTVFSKLSGVARVTGAMLRRARRGDRAYLSVPGQAGVWLFVPLALALRLRGIDYVVHHHSFRPINLGPTRSMRMLVSLGGRRQRHMLLSDTMQRRFTDLYLAGDRSRALVLSNAHLFGPKLVVAERPARITTLGHMSVLTREKGVDTLIDVFARLVARGNDWRLVIAGPCADPALRAEIEAAATAHPDRISYRGAISGAEKERFFADIDLFVLPTTLIDEAEPLVMLEAYGRGVDVVANDTGCIHDRIRTPGHLLTRDRAADAVLIETLMAQAARDWPATRQFCIAHARKIKREADRQAEEAFPKLLPADTTSSRPFASDAAPVT